VGRRATDPAPPAGCCSLPTSDRGQASRRVQEGDGSGVRLGKEGPEARRGGSTASDGRPAGEGETEEGKRKERGGADVRAPAGRGRRRERGMVARGLGKIGLARPTRGKEREECWASWSARAREKEGEEGARKRERKMGRAWPTRGGERKGARGGGERESFGLPFSFLSFSSFLFFLFYTQTIQTNLYEFK
jgi:hypothetical protein